MMPTVGTGRPSSARLFARLTRIEHCLLLAETTAGLLESDLDAAPGSLVAELNREAQDTLGALAVARSELEILCAPRTLQRGALESAIVRPPRWPRGRA
jgi:hypothetical protein